MAQQYDETEKTVNLLLTSVLILLICAIVAAMGYFSYTLGILNPPGASDAPGRTGSASSGAGTGIAAPGGRDSAEAVQEVGEIIFPGFVDFSITDGRDYVDLKNDVSNPVYFRFTVSDDQGKTLYTSGDIRPGEGERWQVTEAFDPGTGKHTLNVSVDSFLLTDDSPCNGVRSAFTVDMG